MAHSIEAEVYIFETGVHIFEVTGQNIFKNSKSSVCILLDGSNNRVYLLKLCPHFLPNFLEFPFGVSITDVVFCTDVLEFDPDAIVFLSDVLKFDPDAIAFLSDALKFDPDAIVFLSDVLKFDPDAIIFLSDVLKFKSDAIVFLSDVLKFKSDALIFFPDALVFFSNTVEFKSDALVFFSDASDTILQDPQALDDLPSVLVHGKHKLIWQY